MKTHKHRWGPWESVRTGRRVGPGAVHETVEQRKCKRKGCDIIKQAPINYDHPIYWM